MELAGLFQCVRCHGTQTELKVIPGEGTVCEDEAACEVVRALGNEKVERD